MYDEDCSQDPSAFISITAQKDTFKTTNDVSDSHTTYDKEDIWISNKQGISQSIKYQIYRSELRKFCK